MFNALALFIGLAFGMPTANDLTIQGKYEESERMLATQRKHDAQWHYLRMINLHFMNDRECLSHAEFILSLQGYEDYPERYFALAWSVKYDVENNWKKKDDLHDISRDMRRVGHRLDDAKGGKKTQEIQGNIVKKLSKMIDKMEDQQKQAAMAQAEKEKKEREQWRQQWGRPMEDSHAANDSGRGTVMEKKMRNLAENWGNLPPKERAKAMIGLTRELPPKYREVIENYFKALAKQDNYKRRKK